MKRKRLLAAILVIAVLVSALVVPAAEDTTIPGVGDLADYTAAFSVEADEARAVDEEGNVYVTFRIYAKSSSAGQPLRAFSFVLAPSDGLELANTVKNKDSRWYYELPNLASLKKHEGEGMYTEFSYTPSSRYFGAGGTDAGEGITDKTELLTIVGKVAAGDPHGTYTLTLVTEGNDIVIAGNGATVANTSHQFKRVVTPSVVSVQSSNTISGTVSYTSGNYTELKVMLETGTEANVSGDGTFSFSEVPNGEHVITATALDGTKKLNGKATIVLTGQNAENLEIELKQGIRGDVNNDGKINNRDLVLMRQYLAGWDVTASEYGLDVNGDGKVNNRDLVLMRQYLAGWDVVFAD